jgi:hypothetical protein
MHHNRADWFVLVIELYNDMKRRLSLIVNHLRQYLSPWELDKESTHVRREWFTVISLVVFSSVVDISKVPQLSTDSVYVFRKLIRQKVRLLQLESLAI